MCINPPISFWGDLSRAESHTLEELWLGLCHLNGIVKKLEHTRLEQDPKAADMMVTTFDSDCGSGDHMLLNYFFWYACSADSFLDLFSKAFSLGDVDSKFSAVRKFRDKVAAHLSHVQPRKDTQATQGASLCQNITWQCGRYSVGRECYFTERDSSPTDWGWELTAIHEKLDAYIRQTLPKGTSAASRLIE